MAARKSIDVADITRRFERICVAHPKLTMVLDTDPDQVDLAMTIPVQDGASFPLRLNLQGDELHLMAGEHFWMECFQSTIRRSRTSFSTRSTVC